MFWQFLPGGDPQLCLDLLLHEVWPRLGFLAGGLVGGSGEPRVPGPGVPGLDGALEQVLPGVRGHPRPGEVGEGRRGVGGEARRRPGGRGEAQASWGKKMHDVHGLDAGKLWMLWPGW